MTVIHWLFSFTRSLAFEFDEFGSQASTIVPCNRFVTTLKSLIVGWKEFVKFHTHSSSHFTCQFYLIQTRMKLESNWKEYEMVCGEAVMRLMKIRQTQKQAIE